MANEGKRIFQYPEVTTLTDDDYALIDNRTGGPKSIKAKKLAPSLMSKTITERGVYKASDDGVRGYNEVNVNIPYTDIHVATGAIATFEGEDLPLKSLTASIEPVQSGSGDPSPTNVRPISGWTGCEMVDDAVYGGFIDWNQLTHNGDFSDGVNDWSTLNNNTQLSANDGVLQVDGSSGRRSYGFYQAGNLVKDHIVLVSSRLKFGKIGGSTERHELIMYVNNSWIPTRINDTTDWFYLDKMFIVEESTTQIGIRHYNLDPAQGIPIIQCDYFKTIDLTQLFGETKANEIYAMEQAEAGSGVAYFKSLFYKDYYPYNSGEITNVSAVNGDTDKYHKYTIPFVDSQGNPVEVYGGSVDVVNGGENSTPLKGIDMSTLDWKKSSSQGDGYFYATLEDYKFDSNITMMCEVYKFEGMKSSSPYWGSDGSITAYFRSGSTTREIYIHDDNYTDATIFKNSLQGKKLVYELATPTTFYTQPTAVKSLDGVNNVFASTGDVDVEYQTVWVRPTE